MVITSFLSTADKNENSHKDRATAYAIEVEINMVTYCDFYCFESAIDNIRLRELLPLLEFYNLSDHSNAHDARVWLFNNQLFKLGFGTTKLDLLAYADFLRDKFIPKLEGWFGSVKI